MRVPFSRAEHSALKAACKRRGCSMQELFISALVVGLGKPGVPTPVSEAGEKLRGLEMPAGMAAGLVLTLGNAVSAALGLGKEILSTGTLGGGEVASFAECLADDVLRSWDKAFDASQGGQGERQTCDTLRQHLLESAAFTDAASRTLANHAARNGLDGGRRLAKPTPPSRPGASAA